MKAFDDMSAFSVTIDKNVIDSAINNLCDKMGYYLSESDFNYRLYCNREDERAFVLAVYYDTPFCGLSIKCKSSFRDIFFDSIRLQLSETESLWGIPHTNDDDMPDWLRPNKYTSIITNPILLALKKANLV
jgi:hypothetical protein